MAEKEISFGHVARLVVDTWTPDVNVEERLDQVVNSFKNLKHHDFDRRAVISHVLGGHFKGRFEIRFSYYARYLLPILYNQFALDRHTELLGTYDHALVTQSPTALNRDTETDCSSVALKSNGGKRRPPPLAQSQKGSTVFCSRPNKETNGSSGVEFDKCEEAPT